MSFGGGDFAVSGVFCLVFRVVREGMMSRAQQSAVLEAGVSAKVPGNVVVGVAHARWPVTSLGGAALVAEAHRDALGGSCS